MEEFIKSLNETFIHNQIVHLPNLLTNYDVIIYFEKNKFDINFIASIKFNDYLYFFNKFLFIKLPYFKYLDVSIVDMHFDKINFNDIISYKNLKFYDVIHEINNYSYSPKKNQKIMILKRINIFKNFLLCKILF